MYSIKKKRSGTRFPVFFLVAFLLALGGFASGIRVFANDATDGENNDYEVTVIGDSVTLSSASAIRAMLPLSIIDAEKSRSMTMGIDIVNEFMQAGELRDYVVIALASNTHKDTIDSATKIIESLADGHKLIFVTGYGKDFMKPATDFIRQLPEVYPFVSVADWDLAVAPRNNLLAADNVHPSSQEAKKLYAQCVLDAIKTADSKPAKGEPDITVLYEGDVIRFAKPPIERNGNIFYPLDAVLQALKSIGIDGWRTDTYAVFTNADENAVKVTFQDMRYVVNGTELEQDDFSPFIENTKMYVYLDSIIQGLGLSAEWDGITRTLTINGMHANG